MAIKFRKSNTQPGNNIKSDLINEKKLFQTIRNTM